MKMQHLRQLMLGSALSLLLNAAAWAERSYTVNFAVDWLPNGWAVQIGTPPGGEPFSSCMTVWQVPDWVKQIAIDHDGDGVAWPASRGARFYTVQITDKTIFPCGNKDKYNTWPFYIIPSLSDGGQSSSNFLKGQVEFLRHFNDKTKMWETSVSAKNIDGRNNPLYMSSATCDSGAGFLVVCSKTPATGDDAGNNIWIYFRYKPK
ncbi:hypothetical protein [Bordetella sp. LUAb4]|uniref:hypothetical protein n=1 Tax=Bordetella sp. LUAb4 TaxID=2843195 RepID=UPI001E3E7218|nr:hypothetical protein [Bordetella sp. LUAb4]